MTYYNDYEILTEAEETQAPSTDMFNKIIGEYVARDKQRSNLSVKLKLSHSLFDTIEFPPVPANFRNIMVKTHFPEKFQNVNNALDPDPMATIDNATDLAYKSFSNLGTLSLAPKSEKNESVLFTGNNALNENLIGSLAYTLGKITGVGVSSAVGGGIAGVTTGVVQTVGVPMAGLAAGAGALGALSARLSPDQAGNYHEDDKKLLQKYGLEQNNGKVSNNQDVIQAIDNYIMNIQNVVEQLLKQVASKSTKSNISKLRTTITKLSTVGFGKTEEWIQSHQEDIIKFSEYRRKFDEIKLERSQHTNAEFQKLLKYIQEHPEKRSVDFNEKLQKIIMTGSQEQLSKNITQLVNDLYKNESVNISDNNVLNEELEDSNNAIVPVDRPTFDADIIYDTVLKSIQEAINQILEADQEEWPDVIWAKERMQELKKGATEQINKQIEIVCRMGNGENMPKGLSGTVTDFIVKHPMRAENLKALWKRHEADLDMRIQRRIKAITSPTGPCEAVQTFLRVTVPTLLAMMITYKSLLVFMRQNDETLMRSMDETYRKNVEQETEQITNSLLTNYKLAYDLAGGYLNKAPGDKTVVYDSKQNIFTADLNYGGAIVYFALKAKKNKDIVNTYQQFADNFDELLPKNADEYFQKMACVLSACGITVSDATSINKLMKLMEAIGSEKTQMYGIIQKIQQKRNTILNHRKEHLENLLKLIIATRGEIINYYNDNKQNLGEIKQLMSKNYDYSFQHKDDNGNDHKKDSRNEKHDIRNIINKCGQNFKKAGYDITKIISGEQNGEKYFNTIFDLYYGLFLHLLTNVKNKPNKNLAYIDYQLLDTVIDMLASDLPKVIDAGGDFEVSELAEYGKNLKDIVDNGYNPETNQDALLAFPDVNTNEIDKIDTINNMLNDNVELTNSDDNNDASVNNGSQERYGVILQNILDNLEIEDLKNKLSEIKNINDAYKLDFTNESVKNIIDMCNSKLYTFLTNEKSLEKFGSVNNFDELYDTIKKILHNCIILAYHEFDIDSSARINFEEVWNTAFTIKSTGTKTSKSINLTLSQICSIVQQVENWLGQDTQKDSSTKQYYEELKTKCNESFKNVFNVDFDLFNIFSDKDINDSKSFKSKIPSDIAGQVIKAIMTMFNDINTSDKCEIFNTFFSCVCQPDNSGNSDNSNDSNNEQNQNEKK